MKLPGLVTMEVDGASLAFRPLSATEAERLAAEVAASEDGGLEACIAACREVCTDPAAFDLVVDRYPLAFFGDDGVAGALVEQRSARASRDLKDAISRWKRADRLPVRMAMNLLAFKAYTGGDPSPEALAGALTVSEWMQATKGIFTMFMSLLKALSRRR
jgi:hypothetical protein